MKVILDTNVLISALVKDSTNREIIGFSSFEFYYPEEAKNEIEKYTQEIVEKSGLNYDNYQNLYNWLFSRINLVKQNELEPFILEAKEIMDKIDSKDTIFIACALAYEGSFIWSDDGHFEKQNRIKLLKTKDISKYFEIDTI